MCRAGLNQTVCRAPKCNRQISVENGIRHPFCGKICASKYGDFVYAPDPNLPRVTVCTRAGCNKPPYVEKNGRYHPYCGRTCASVTKHSLPQMDSLQKNPPQKNSPLLNIPRMNLSRVVPLPPAPLPPPLPLTNGFNFVPLSNNSSNSTIVSPVPYEGVEPMKNINVTTLNYPMVASY